MAPLQRRIGAQVAVDDAEGVALGAATLDGDGESVVVLREPRIEAGVEVSHLVLDEELRRTKPHRETGGPHASMERRLMRSKHGRRHGLAGAARHGQQDIPIRF